MDVVHAPTGGSSHNPPRPHPHQWFITQPAPSTPPGQVAPLWLPGHVPGHLPNGQGASGPQSSPQQGAPADSLLGGVCSTSARREQKTRGRTSGTSSRPTPRLAGGPHRRGSSAPSCPAASQSQQENDGQDVSVWLKSIFFVRSQALGLDGLKYAPLVYR